MKINKEFEINGLRYPTITRHGWNIPLNGMQEFYMTKLGVLADATAICGLSFEFNKHNTSIIIKWSDIFLPYYASINKGYEFVYTGEEEDRGILEMPLLFDLSDYIKKGFIEKYKRDIENLPSGALLSTYCHPHRSLKIFFPLVNFLKKNYKINFVTADKYLNLYMKHFPRPILIDVINKKAYWAYYNGKNMQKICLAECIKFYSNGFGKYRVDIDTFAAIPMLAIFVGENKRIIWNNIKYEIPTMDKQNTILLKDVHRGVLFFNTTAMKKTNPTTQFKSYLSKLNLIIGNKFPVILTCVGIEIFKADTLRQ